MPPECSLSDTRLEVILNSKNALMRVYDKRCGKVWQQLPFGTNIVIKNAEVDGNKLKLDLLVPFPLLAILELTETSELVWTLSTEADTEFEKLTFPPAFQTPDAGHYLLQTDGEGMLLPVTDREYPMEEQPLFFTGRGASMAWVGMTDHRLETGYMAIFETSFDAAIQTSRDSNDLLTFAPVWLSSMRQFSYPRRIRYIFFDHGGYVAQCKVYREYIWPKNKVRTLRENQQRFPAIEKILGAVHIYVWDGPREVEFARRLKAAGIEKAMLLWNPNHTPYPEPGYDNRLKELGYATGGYALFSDIHPDSHPGYAKLPAIPLLRNTFPGLYEKISAVNTEGSHYSNQFGTYVCPEAVRPEIVKRVEKELADYPHETYFLDVYQANGLYECYIPQHPLTRQQYAEAIIKNMELLEDRYHLFLGGEWGADFSGSRCVYVHGMMTLQRNWFNSDIQKKGTIHYYGNWKNNPRPTQMLSTRVAPDIYHRYSVNETNRIPLYELVYHDAIVTSWRWEDCGHQTPEIWWKKDLFNILYGSAPLWSIDQDRWESFEVSFVESYQKVCPWLQQICYDEMLSHRFISGDCRVQETLFSSGKRAVVNFGDEAFDFEGKTIQPRSFLTFES